MAAPPGVVVCIRVREPEVPPLPGLSCHFRLCFPRLPPWATLWRPSGTLGNIEFVHYPRWQIRCVESRGSVLCAKEWSKSESTVRVVYAARAEVGRNSVRNKIITILLGLLTVSVALFAHHGAAAYDTSKRITVKATITEWFWANPHCFLKFDAKDDKGNIVHWATEASNPSDMINLGWSKQTFKPGDEVTVTFMPVKNGQPVGRIEQVVLANGQTLSARVVFQNQTGSPSGLGVTK